jgi:hypothetical protein
MDDYQGMAQQFLNDTHTDLSIKWIDHDYYLCVSKRDIYYTKLARGNRSYAFKFGQSVANSSRDFFQRKRPTQYDILACLTKSDPETFEDFCLCYGYDTDSISALNTYNRVCDEYKGLKRLYSDAELLMLSDIV